MKVSVAQLTESNFYQKLAPLFSVKRLPLVFIFLGSAARLSQYLANRSLWADEATLALNIVNRSYQELLQPLDYGQGAPVGFLLAAKLGTQLLGNNEYGLRLFPLLGGILSLVLFYELAKKFLAPVAVAIAMALFACLTPLIYYSSEVKQYSTDVTVALLAALLVWRLDRQSLNPIQILIGGMVGAIILWFSHTGVFALAGFGAAVALLSFLKKDYVKVGKLVIVYLFWAISFGGFYFISMAQLSAKKGDLTESWGSRGGFMPFPPLSPKDFAWFPQTLVDFFNNPLFSIGEPEGFITIAIAIALLAFITGCLMGFFNRRETLLILMAPLLVTLLASGLEKYPFSGRLLLFLTPFFILVIAEGMEILLKRLQAASAEKIGILLLVLLLAFPVASGASRVARPILRQEIKPVISHIKNNQQPGDVLYIFHRAEYMFEFYAKQYGYQPGDYIIGASDLDDDTTATLADWRNYQADLDKLKGNKRVWILFSQFAHVPIEKAFFDFHLESIARELESFETHGAIAKLYDFS